MRYFILIFVFFISSCQLNMQDNNKTIYTDNANIWHYIANKSSLDYPNNKRINNEINWFIKHPDYLERVSRRASPYLHLVVSEIEKEGLPIEIALLPIVESAYDPFAFSHGTAQGLWQFIPSTGKLYGLEEDWWYSERRDVLASTRAAVKYLKNLNILFKGDWFLAIAAYNAGPGRVLKAIERNKIAGKKVDFWNLDLPRETKQYVPRLIALSEIVKNTAKYQQRFIKIENESYLKEITLYSQFDLALISKWTGLSVKDIYTFNPGLRRWATPSYVPFTILLPVEVFAVFEKKLQENIDIPQISWVRHKIKSGESIISIAKKYNTTTHHIIGVNELENDVILANEYLIVPLALKEKSYYELSQEQRELDRLNAQKNAKKIIYTIVTGDSLWGIAQKFNVAIKDIVKWNHIIPTEYLHIDKQLVIWLPEKDKNKIAKTIQTGIYVNRNIIYTVKAGDNLYKIAQRYKVSVDDIIKWNNMKNANIISPGTKLNITIDIINSQIH